MSTLLIVLAGVCGSCATYFLNNNINLGAVMSSAIVSVTGGLLFFLFPNLLDAELTEILPMVIMGASFVGMASKKTARNYFTIVNSGILFSIIFICTGSFFEGFGGSLGTTAAIAFCSSLGLRTLILQYRS